MKPALQKCVAIKVVQRILKDHTLVSPSTHLKLGTYAIFLWPWLAFNAADKLTKQYGQYPKRSPGILFQLMKTPLTLLADDIIILDM